MKIEPQKETVTENPGQSGPLTSSEVALPAKHRLGPWRVLRNRNYSLLFWGQLISSAGTQMQVVAVAWQVYLLTHSAIALGLIGLVQAIPRLIFSLVGGVFADVFDRRKMLIVIEIVLALTSAVLALCTAFHVINMVIIYSVVLIAASVSSFEFPTRQAMIPTLVRREEMTDALSLSMVMMQLTFIIGPTVGGFAIAWIGVANTYWFDVISYFVVIGSLLLMVVPRIPAEKRAQAGFGALVDGMKFLRAHPVILAVLSLDFFATFFGSPRALSAGLCQPNYAYRPTRTWNFNSGNLYWCSCPGTFHRIDWAHYPPGSWSRTCNHCLGPMYHGIWSLSYTLMARGTLPRWSRRSRYDQYDSAWPDHTANNARRVSWPH